MSSLLSVFARLVLHMSSSSWAGKRYIIIIVIIAIITTIIIIIVIIILSLCMFAGALAGSLQKWR